MSTKENPDSYNNLARKDLEYKLSIARKSAKIQSKVYLEKIFYLKFGNSTTMIYEFHTPKARN